MDLVKTINHHQRIVCDRYNALARAYGKNRQRDIVDAANALSSTLSRTWNWYRDKSINHATDLNLALLKHIEGKKVTNFRGSIIRTDESIDMSTGWEVSIDPAFSLLLVHPFTAALTVYAVATAQYSVSRPQLLAYIANVVLGASWGTLANTNVEALGNLIAESERTWNQFYAGTANQTTTNFYPVLLVGEVGNMTLCHEVVAVPNELQAELEEIKT